MNKIFHIILTISLFATIGYWSQVKALDSMPYIPVNMNMTDAGGGGGSGGLSPADQMIDGVNSVGGSNVSENQLKSTISVVTTVLMFITGAVAVIAIIIGGIRYVTANGDASNLKSAKDTIFYAVVGLIIAIISYAVVNWVADKFSA